MRSAIGIFVRLSAIAAFVAGAVVSCGDDDAVRPSLAPSDAATDAPSLPEAGEPTDAGTVDARPAYDASTPAVACAVTPCVVALTAGASHYCARLADQTARCWGAPALLGASEEQRDAGSDAALGTVPIAPSGLGEVAFVRAAQDRTCAVFADGGVSCWGSSSPIPSPVADAPAARDVALGVEIACAVTVSGALECWGDSSSLGSGRRAIDLGGEASGAVAIGHRAAFVTNAKDELLSWGADAVVLGRPISRGWVDLFPTKVWKIPPVRDVAASPIHACAITTDGRLFCWGRGENGMLGLGYARDELYPVEVALAGPAYPQSVTASRSHTCVRMTSDEAYCWGGRDERGELGRSKFGGGYIPVRVDPLPKDVVSVVAGNKSTCALSRDGTVRCWGDNSSGQLGRGVKDGDRHWTPEPVLFH